MKQRIERKDFDFSDVGNGNVIRYKEVRGCRPFLSHPRQTDDNLATKCDVFRAFYRSILTTVFHHLTPFSFQSIYVHVISLPPSPLNKETLISLLKLTSPFRPPLEKTFPMYLRATYNRYEFPLQFIIPLSFVHFRSNIFSFFLTNFR